MFKHFLKLNRVCWQGHFDSNVKLFVFYHGKLSITRSLTKSVIFSQNENEEILKAKKARNTGNPTVFDKIINKEIKADILYEDENCLAFNDVNPQAPVHFLVIPKKRISMLEKANEADKLILGKLLLVAKTLASDKLKEGFRIVINNGVHGSQSVYHLHLHVLGGRQMKWPPG